MVCMPIFRIPAKHLHGRRGLLALAAAFALALCARPARADLVPEQPHNAIVLDTGLHVLGIGYQRTITSNIALQLDVEAYAPYTQSQNWLNASPGYDNGVWGGVIRFRPFFYGIFHTPYPAGGPPTGFWVSPFGQFGIVNAIHYGVLHTGHAWAAGLSGGWAWLFGRHFWLALGAGGQYHVANIPGAGIYPPSFARVYPQIDINLGLAF